MPRPVILRVLDSYYGHRIFVALLGQDYLYFHSDDEKIDRFIHELKKINNKELEAKIEYDFFMISNYLNIKDLRENQILSSYVDGEDTIQRIYLLKIGQIISTLEDDSEREKLKEFILHFESKFEDPEKLYQIIKQILVSINTCEYQLMDLLTKDTQYEESASGVYASELGLSRDVIYNGLRNPNGRRIYEVLKGEKVRYLATPSEKDIGDFIDAFNRLQYDVFAWEIRNAFFEISNVEKSKHIREDEYFNDLICSINQFKIWKIKKQMNEKVSNIDLVSLTGRLINLKNPHVLLNVLSTLKRLTHDQIINLIDKLSFLL